MALSERTTEDKIEVVGDHKVIQVRTGLPIIERDGVEISRSFHRHVVSPNDDITGESSEVQAIANALWTDEVKSCIYGITRVLNTSRINFRNIK